MAKIAARRSAVNIQNTHYPFCFGHVLLVMPARYPFRPSPFPEHASLVLAKVAVQKDFTVASLTVSSESERLTGNVSFLGMSGVGPIDRHD